jgi:molecular chaperone GrpE
LDGGERGENPPRSEEAPAPSLAGALELPPEPGQAEAYERRARLAEDRLAEVLAAYRQVKTENEGHRERIARNLERRFDQRRERLLLKFIDILDNLDRALEAVEQTYAGAPLIEGIILVRTQLLQTLQEEGLERIPVLGLPYDPNVAEAVATQPVAEPEHHHLVVKEMLRGYRLNGRVARASRVIVGEYGADQAAASGGEMVGADEVAQGPRSALTPEDERTLAEIISRAEESLRTRHPPADDEGLLDTLLDTPPKEPKS